MNLSVKVVTRVFGKAKVPTSVGVEFRWSIVCHAVSSAGFCSKVRFFSHERMVSVVQSALRGTGRDFARHRPHSAFIDEFKRDTADAHTVRYQSNFIMTIDMIIYIIYYLI